MNKDEMVILPAENYFDDDIDSEAEAIVPMFHGPICAEKCPKDLKFNGGNPVILCEKYRVILGRSDNVFFNRCEECIKKHGR